MQTRLSSYKKALRQKRKKALVDNKIIDEGNTQLEAFNMQIDMRGEEQGSTHRVYLHPTKGFKARNRMFDGLDYSTPEGRRVAKLALSNAINNNLFNKGIRFGH